jgi:cation diffusion facilitator family transporter
VSVISEAMHSGVDLIAAVIAFFAVRTSGRKADRYHPYGHCKVENIAGTTEALLIFFAAAWIIYEAVRKLFYPQAMEDVGWGIAVMSGSALANAFVSHMLAKVGKETDSIALKADGMHLRTDVYTSLGVMAGLLLYWTGSRLFPSANIHWIDPVAAITVALLIMRAAFVLTRESFRDLLDARLPTEEEEAILQYARRLRPRLLSVHAVKSRKSGPYRFFDFHMVVDANMTVKESHDLGDQLVAMIKHDYPEAKATIHTEPCDLSCKPACVDNCVLKETKDKAE